MKRQLLLSGLLDQGLGAREGPEKYRARIHAESYVVFS